jgi:DNA-binding NtrC family response regulator
MDKSKILVIDDEPKILGLLKKILTLEGFNVVTVENSANALEIINKDNILVVLSDVKLPDTNGIELTKMIKSVYPGIEIILLTAYGNIKDGIEAMKNGAFDYLVKGDDDDKVPLTVKRAFDKAVMNNEINHLRKKVEDKYSFNIIIGKSKKISDAIELAKKAAPTETTILLTGETGTGKELFAQAIHYSSQRRNKKFVAFNSSAIPNDLLESELFGYKKGAFTGANFDKKGYFEEANGGTIFLDEIGDMSLGTQAKLLRTIETKTYLRLGDPKERTIDVRIIAATNKNLEEEINKCTFREDLYYRLNTFVIKLPALRERPDDIEMLVKYFIDVYSHKLNKKIDKISKEFFSILSSYSFYGNIRELKNIIERAVILSDSNELNVKHLPEDIGKEDADNKESKSLDEVEKVHILKILEENDGNKTKTAKELGIGIVTLYRKLKEYGLE